jgi:hypothetical protein
MFQEKNLKIYSNRLKDRANNLKYCLKSEEWKGKSYSTQEGSFDFVWNVEEGVRFLPKNLDSIEMAIVDVLLDFFNKGRIFNLSLREVESYLRDENHQRAFPETQISEKLFNSWIRDLIRGYYSCNVPQRIFQGNFENLDLLQKIRAVKHLLDTLTLSRLKVELVEIEYPELVFKVEVEELVEGLNLEGFSGFWQEYLRRYFKKEELVVQIEKNL